VDSAARLRINNSFALRDAVARRLGIAQLPLVVATHDGRTQALVRILPEWELPRVPVQAVFPGTRYLTPTRLVHSSITLLRRSPSLAIRTIEARLPKGKLSVKNHCSQWRFERDPDEAIRIKEGKRSLRSATWFIGGGSMSPYAGDLWPLVTARDGPP
jgi:hypothetical protein